MPAMITLTSELQQFLFSGNVGSIFNFMKLLVSLAS